MGLSVREWVSECMRESGRLENLVNTIISKTRDSAIAEEPRDALRQLKYYARFLTKLLTRSSANPQEPCKHTVS